MKKLTLPLLTLLIALVSSCCSGSASDDEEPTTDIPAGNNTLQLAVTGRVGAVVDDQLTNYVTSLNLLAFRQNRQGTYVLYQAKTLTKAQLTALENSSGSVSPGYTALKKLTIDLLPVGTYRVVGLANALDDDGNPLPNVSLAGVTTGNTMEQIIASVTDGTESPRFFYGITSPVTLGAQQVGTPQLALNRKVSMFVLTLKNVPEVVDKIELQTQNTYGSFDMSGSFLPLPLVNVNESTLFDYASDKDGVILWSVTLPTGAAARSTFVVTFTLDNGQVINASLPQYTLKENTITRLTATVNPEKPGEQWKFDLTFDLTVNIEWNVDQEPSIEI